jgi:hypothetical protein
MSKKQRKDVGQVAGEKAAAAVGWAAGMVRGAWPWPWPWPTDPHPHFTRFTHFFTHFTHFTPPPH